MKEATTNATLKLALEVAEEMKDVLKQVNELVAENKALKEALVPTSTQCEVQPEKEPLEYWNVVEGWVKIDEVHEHFGSVGCGTIYKTAGEDRVPVYTIQPKEQHSCDKRPWVGLTAQEAADCWTTSASKTWHNLEAKLKEKNT